MFWFIYKHKIYIYNIYIVIDIIIHIVQFKNIIESELNNYSGLLNTPPDVHYLHHSQSIRNIWSLEALVVWISAQ
jgi:hypothetical protein